MLLNKYKIIITLALTLFAVFTAVHAQQIPVLPLGSIDQMSAAERAPLVFSGECDISGTAYSSTKWIQIGYSSEATESANRNISLFNPEFFSLVLKLSTTGSGDSSKISSGWFESAIDTTESPQWNADSSNFFISANATDHTQYGYWRFESLQSTGNAYIYPLRALIGGFIRFNFQSDIADTSHLEWKLVCEH